MRSWAAPTDSVMRSASVVAAAIVFGPLDMTSNGTGSNSGKPSPFDATLPVIKLNRLAAQVGAERDSFLHELRVALRATSDDSHRRVSLGHAVDCPFRPIGSGRQPWPLPRPAGCLVTVFVQPVAILIRVVASAAPCS